MSRQADQRKTQTAERRATQPKGGFKDDIPFKGFVNYELPISEKDQFNEAWEAGDLWELLDGYAEEGYRFSLKQGGQRGEMMCVVAQSRPDHPDAGYVYTERSGSALKALAKALYSMRRTLSGHFADHVAERRAYW